MGAYERRPWLRRGPCGSPGDTKGRARKNRNAAFEFGPCIKDRKSDELIRNYFEGIFLFGMSELREFSTGEGVAWIGVKVVEVAGGLVRELSALSIGQA